MNLTFDISVAKGYKSSSQITRVLTEHWVKNNIYCPSCGNEKLNSFPCNSPVADFYCSKCRAEYELKSKKDSFSLKIVDGAFESMIARINAENNPNFFFLNYLKSSLKIINFLVIPKHYFVNDVIEKRRPLGPYAKRAGWIGCNILLHNVPEAGKVFLIKNSVIQSREQVLLNWSKTSFLAHQNKEKRGWMIEIMKVLDKIPKRQFKLRDVYEFESELRIKYPNNNFVKLEFPHFCRHSLASTSS
jgi:type II restriction enzyme